MLIILTSTILLVGIGLWNWLSFSGMEATFIPFSILLIILTIEIISIIIIGLKLTKGQDGKEKISTEWKLSIIIAGIILLMTIGIFGRELLSGGTEFTGGLNIPAQLSLLILILMIEITSLVIMGIKIMKPNWHQVEKEKITTKWLVLTLFGVIILLTTIGIMGRLQFTGALNIPFIFSTIMFILISEIIMISFTVIILLKPNWYQEGEEKKSTKWLILTLIFSIVLLMSIGISGWFLLKIIIFR